MPNFTNFSRGPIKARVKKWKYQPLISLNCPRKHDKIRIPQDSAYLELLTNFHTRASLSPQKYRQIFHEEIIKVRGKNFYFCYESFKLDDPVQSYMHFQIYENWQKMMKILSMR